MSALEEKAIRLSELQSDLGKALWQTQAFEDTLAHLIALVLKMPANASLAEAEAVLDNVRRDTLGKLLRHTRKAIHIDESLEPFIKRFLDDRNWLVHRSWRMYHNVIFRSNEYSNLRYRLRGLAQDALELNELFAGVIADWVKRQGADEATLRKLEEEFLNVWHTET